MLTNRVLSIAVHPDDETLGSGGTLLKHIHRKDEVFWLIITKVTEEDGYDPEFINNREKEIEKVSKLYGFSDTFKLGLPTTRLTEIPDRILIPKIKQVFSDVRPNIVYLPFKDDVHSDHRKAFEAAYSATKIFREKSVRKICMVETLSETEFSPSLKETSFLPNSFSNITDFFEKKVEILRVYDSEMQEHPFPRSIEGVEALAKFRGLTAGCRYAESFMMLKEIF